MRNSVKTLATVLVAALWATTWAGAQDIEGGQDHPLVGRFAGSTITYYKSSNYDETRLMQSPDDYHEMLARSGPDYREGAAWLDLEGAITRIRYAMPEGHSSLEVIRVYQGTLESEGFATLFSCASEECIPGGTGDDYVLGQLMDTDNYDSALYGAKARYMLFALNPPGATEDAILMPPQDPTAGTGYGPGSEALPTSPSTDAPGPEMGYIPEPGQKYPSLMVVPGAEPGAGPGNDQQSAAGPGMTAGGPGSDLIPPYDPSIAGGPGSDVGGPGAELAQSYEPTMAGGGGPGSELGAGPGLDQQGEPFVDYPGPTLEPLPFDGTPPGATVYVAILVAEAREKTTAYVEVVEVGGMSDAALIAAQPPAEAADVVDATETAAQMAADLDSGQPVNIYGLTFASDSADLEPDSEPTLNEIAQLLYNQPDLMLDVVGHTDDRGAASYNRGLSERRAGSVVQALVDDYGIASERLSPSGQGMTQPIADNSTPDGRALNRRVELISR